MTVLGGVVKDSRVELDPTRAAVSKPWSPMSPEQLDSYRPKPVVVAPLTLAQEAKRISYQSGIAALEGIVLRLQALEKLVAELQSK